MPMPKVQKQIANRWKEKAPGLGVSTSAVRERPLRVIGFGLFWSWIWLLFQNSERIAAAESPSLLLTLLCYLPTLFYTLGFVTIGILYRTRHIVPGGRLYETSLAIALTVGTVFVVTGFWLYPTHSQTGFALCFLGCILAGFCASFLHTEWVRLFVSLGARATLINCVFATLLAGAIVLATEVAPLWVVWPFLMAVPGVSAVILFRDPLQHCENTRASDSPEMYLPWKLLATAFVQGLSLGLIAVLSSSFFEAPSIAATVGYILGALLIFGVVLFFRVDYNSFIYKIGFPIMATAWLVVLVMGQANSFSIGAHATGYRFVDLAIWSVTIYIIKEKQLPTNWVCAVNTSALMAGQFLGTGLALLPTLSVLRPLKEQFLGMYAALMVFLLFMVALLVFSTKNLKTGWGLVRPSDETAPDALAEACRKLGSYRRLTRREVDILIYLARGRNRAFICEELVLAQDTVKTYIRTVYRKLEVHSQQELISIVEEQMRDGRE